MTEPQPTGPPEPQPDPTPPQPQPRPPVDDPLDRPQGDPEPKPSGGDPDDDDDPQTLKALLNTERRASRKLQQQLNTLQRAQLSDNERAISEAREAGRLDALKESATKVAAATLKATAAGKLPTEVVAEISPERFVTDEGDVDEDAIKALVDKLHKAVPAVPNGKVPAGPRSTEPETSDWLRQAMTTRRG
jgi:hypothetical protein